MFLVAVTSSFFTVLMIVASLGVLSGQVFAQKIGEMSEIPKISDMNLSQQRVNSSQVTESIRYVSVSGLAFLPLNQTATYSKEVTQQLLSLNSQNHNFAVGSNIFVAPLNLPDQSRLLNLTVFGQDADKQGAVWLRLKRCDHGQPRCVVIAETTSTDVYALGSFETTGLSLLNEVIDNSLYSYLLETQLTALLNSGLRSVRLAIVDNQTTAQAVTNVEKWSLSGGVRSFVLPNTSLTEIRICADDLSHLSNSTHYPRLLVDGKATTLVSKQCVTIWGSKIELQRDFNAGNSSGTYQILR